MYRFEIQDWAACAPGLLSQQDWADWSADPSAPLPCGEDLPSVSSMAPMLRRRLGGLGRAALHCTYSIRLPGVQIPLVFASRHGETNRLRPMLSDLAAGEPLSPTAFGLAVHNAISGLYSIDQADTGVMQAIAAGRDTVEAAMTEAVALLADGHESVAVVVCDAPLDVTYRGFADEPECLYACAWRIGRPTAGRPSISLSQCAPDATTAPASVPHGLAVLRFFLGGERELRHPGPRTTWIWQRHD